MVACDENLSMQMNISKNTSEAVITQTENVDSDSDP